MLGLHNRPSEEVIFDNFGDFYAKSEPLRRNNIKILDQELIGSSTKHLGVLKTQSRITTDMIYNSHEQDEQHAHYINGDKESTVPASIVNETQLFTTKGNVKFPTPYVRKNRDFNHPHNSFSPLSHNYAQLHVPENSIINFGVDIKYNGESQSHTPVRHYHTSAVLASN